jgi:hypothetical protein
MWSLLVKPQLLMVVNLLAAQVQVASMAGTREQVEAAVSKV